MSNIIPLEATKRTVVGKQVRQLRAVGVIPAIIYGPGQEPVTVAVEWTNLRTVLRQAGGTGLVEIKVNGSSFTTLIRQVDRHPVRGDVLHVDFYAVRLDQKLVSTVRIVLKNVDETRNRLGGAIAHEVLTVDVESLPTGIPSEVIVDVSDLRQIGDVLHVRDIPPMEGIEFVSDPDMVIARAEYLQSGAEEEEEAAGESVMAEPERITRRKAEEVED